MGTNQNVSVHIQFLAKYHRRIAQVMLLLHRAEAVAHTRAQAVGHEVGIPAGSMPLNNYWSFISWHNLPIQ